MIRMYAHALQKLLIYRKKAITAHVPIFVIPDIRYLVPTCSPSNKLAHIALHFPVE